MSSKIINFLNNKSAIIWAFDEMIDRKTDNDGNSFEVGLKEIKKIIYYALTNTVDEEILSILIIYGNLINNNNINIFTATSNNDINDDINNHNDKYYLCGWIGHSIIIFATNKKDTTCDFGIINCGEGAEIHGISNSICNGIIVFKNIEKSKIKNFLNMYKDFLIVMDKINIPLHSMYKSFYLMLFKEILNMNTVNFLALKMDNIIETEFYELSSQNIGSCVFTNTINIVYYLYIINSNTPDSLYSIWYKTIKNIIKIKIYDEIISKMDIKYYNIYKYILDTTPSISRSKYYESNSNKNILEKIYDYTTYNNLINKVYISRNYNLQNYYTDINSGIMINETAMFWNLYNNIPNADIDFSNMYFNSNNKEDTLLNLFDFFYNESLLDNNMKILIPLLILYNLKNNNNITFDKLFLINILKKYYTKNNIENNDNYIYTSNIIYICIFILIIKDTDSIKSYYDKNEISSVDYKNRQKLNFEYYNLTVFQFIPIINKYYHKIIILLIKDLYNNIEILPDITNKSYTRLNIESIDSNIIGMKYYKLIIDPQTKTKSFIEYHILLRNINIEQSMYINFIMYESENININFLLWFFFIYNKNDISSDINFDNKKFRFDFEVYGNRKLLLVDNELLLIDSYSNDVYFHNPGKEILYKQKLNLFFDNIKTELKKFNTNESESLSKMISLYIIYFYLYYLKDETDIFYKKYYNKDVTKYFKNIYYGPFINIIKLYIYTYNLTYNINKNVFIIDDKTLIPSIERKFFTLQEYEYYTNENNLNISTIDFFIIYTNDYNLLFYSNDENTLESIEIIKNHLLPSKFSIYLILNFYWFNDKLNNNIIHGINKYDNNITIYYNYNIGNIKYNEYAEKFDVINFTDLKNEHITYQNFYRLMSNNDNGLFLYKKINKDDSITYMLRTLRYNFIFIMKNFHIYICIDNIEYEVFWCNDIDTFNNYGILKLLKGNDIKMICIYNYDCIKNINPNNLKCIDFINKSFKSSDEEIFKSNIVKEYKLYYYTILNKYNDKCIFTNISDVLALLINCLYYNSPFLILKNIEQIKIILNNNDHNKNNLNKLLNTLFLNFDNIYSLPILFLFYENEKNIGNFYYKSSNIIYNLYKILLRLEINDTFRNNFSYSKIAVILYDSTKNIIPIHEETKKIFLYFNKTTSSNYEGILESTLKVIINIQIHDYYNETTDYKLTVSNTPMPNMLKYCKLLIQSEENTTNEDDFKKLVILFCPMFCNNGCNDNISKARKLYDYLIREGKDFIHPIQEMIMGSGKSTVLTSYICILLLNNFLSQESFINKEIYIVLPELLINTSFEILMKNLFVLFNNIEVLIYPNKRLYDKSFILYLISDTNYKIMFLQTEVVDIDNKYMIYDEIDMMANPLTCELNIPFIKDTLHTSDNILYTLSEILYTKIFTDFNFWIKIKYTKKNDIHDYIYIINDIDITTINDYFNIIFKSYINDHKEILEYIKNNILIFILTKQFNFDYGLPEKYNLDTVNIYKFKAIPYSSVDNPVMGSEFSDPILTYILTFFCYNIVKGKFRKIDKDYIVEYYSNLYYKEEVNIDILSSFFNIKRTFDYNYYRNNKEYYMNNYNDIFDIYKDINFKIILTKILEMNNTYYKTCYNISFNQLLLSKNVKNFICFTGTAYITPPKGISTDNNFALSFIDKAMLLNNNDGKEYNIKNTIKNIINDRNIIINIYNNKKSNELIENIFACLSSYEVLIDIGGVFINYNINKFIEKYKKILPRKKYIVYFDNGRKIKNLVTDQFETDKSIIQTDNEAFYFFSNKDITGVDVKNIMNSAVHGLVVITNKTNMRDFSQGIFRMRRLLDKNHETFDIIFDNLFDTIINQQGSIINNDSNCANKLTNSDIRNNIIENLDLQQRLIDEQKTKVLLKQNIFGLVKNKTNDRKTVILFIDPSNLSDYLSINETFTYFKNNNSKKYNLTNFYFNIDNKNIFDFLEQKIHDNINTLLKQLIIDYNLLCYSDKIITETKISFTQQMEVSIEIVKTKNIENIICYSDIIYYNFRSESTIYSTNQLLCLYLFKNKLTQNIQRHDVLLIYNNKSNILVILSIYQLSRFLLYNTDIFNYTYISLYNNKQYGKGILPSLKSYLILEALKIFKNENNIDKYLNKLILYLSIDTSINISSVSIPTTELTLIFNNNNIKCNTIAKDFIYYRKYVKYKNKYINLIT